MKKTIFQICICIFPFASSISQENGRFALSANFGLNGSFFVRSYPENGGGIEFYKKNFIGTSGGAELKYRLNKRSSISLGYMRSENKKEVDFYGVNSGISLDIISFNIRHNEHIFYAGYERSLFKRKPGLKIQGGIYYVVPVQQEIELIGNSINIWERSKDFGLQDLGVFIGFQYSRQIDTHFELGIQSRIFYVVTAVFLDQITLTPTLTYHFSKTKNKKSKLFNTQ